eukprot:CAMPEP_0183366920 /NCGR_PEP_ID=MMETSP0164_2-20130417/90596_1 /TAXON_ID=221442 /ORGANISM="Coccolithus pelagicus ssp braarudi, Strain PLY182g" /LENGTH=140 /DNA_ID=CAMNT_0025542765 /DNA_START=23 /DNA_END=441 /DNA_ORIENTATION=+
MRVVAILVLVCVSSVFAAQLDLRGETAGGMEAACKKGNCPPDKVSESGPGYLDTKLPKTEHELVDFDALGLTEHQDIEPKVLHGAYMVDKETNDAHRKFMMEMMAECGGEGCPKKQASTPPKTTAAEKKANVVKGVVPQG